AAFDEDGIRPDEIRPAISKCVRTLDWPPSLPEFLKICRPPLDYEAAHAEAVEQIRRREFGEDQWSSPVVYWAATRIGNDLRSFAYQSIKGRWRSEIDKADAEIKAGKLPDRIPVRAVLLPPPGQTTPPPEAVKEMLAKMRIQIGGGDKLRDEFMRRATH
ncbi:MAG TPA: hypothetical protein VLG93_08535, partial [Sulfuricaulis sp.]|nr:hypothetical protein [Sulfuricaulis sp.]